MIAVPAIPPRFSWADYRRWPDGERWELIDGRAWAMAPAPSISHQTVAGRCYARLERHLQVADGKTPGPGPAPARRSAPRPPAIAPGPLRPRARTRA
ncbi:MAG: Uma2 family endonuclease [Chromatiaceae bacterium]|nr:Uma2 family endonuclease [Candidatus Thioaporhodococcus sediminis]